jgi:serine/threonine protein kinase
MLCPNCFQDKTATACTVCSYTELGVEDGHRLPLRTELKGGRYLVGATLGRGGFGITYKAYDQTHFKAIVVIKECMLPGLGEVNRSPNGKDILVSPGFQETYRKWLNRFYEEAKIISKFQHPNIVRIVDFFFENNTAYYVMPLVEGIDLRTHLEARGGRITESELLPIARSLISAMTALHGKGLIHRDIKPQNIILLQSNTLPVLIDFGAARKQFDGDDSLSHMGVQTEGYSPIEQVMASKNQGPSTDVYSLCATLYRALAGAAPMPADKRIDKNGIDRYQLIESLVPEISSSFAKMINKGLSHGKGKRWQSAREMEDLIPSPNGKEASITKIPSLSAYPGGSDRDSDGAIMKFRKKHLDRVFPQWMLLSPTAIAFLGVFGANSPWNYLTREFFMIAVVNVVLWLIYRAKFEVNEQTTDGSSTPALHRPVSQEQERVGTITFLDSVMAGQQFNLKQGQVFTIGRASPSDIVVKNSHMSKQHVMIRFHDPDFEVMDLQSTNGTYKLNYEKSGKLRSVKKIDRYLGHGIFNLGPYEREQMRIECSSISR